MNHRFDFSISDRFSHEATLKISSRFFVEATRPIPYFSSVTGTVHIQYDRVLCDSIQ